MDPANQKMLIDLTEQFGAQNVILLLGAAEAETATLLATTARSGDPFETGPLTARPLGLAVYHATETLFKEAVSPEIYDDQVAMMEMVLDVNTIESQMRLSRISFL